MKVNAREDDFHKRREHLDKMSKEELKNYFWELTEKVVNPLLELSYESTTLSIERSVLLRMGYSSIDAGIIVKKIEALELLKYGAGHIVYLTMQEYACSLNEAKEYILQENLSKVMRVIEKWD